MIGLLLGTCLALGDCTYEIVESKPEWHTETQCAIDSAKTLMDLGIIPAKNQVVMCDKLVPIKQN